MLLAFSEACLLACYRGPWCNIWSSELQAAGGTVFLGKLVLGRCHDWSSVSAGEQPMVWLKEM
jgi:hypothetical protein